jgi:hypothetical protein
MIVEKRNTLKPLIESSGGLHLTAYYENSGDLNELKQQIEASIEKAEAEIRPVISSVQRRLFLAPLRLLKNNDHLLRSIKHNIGVFRTAHSFRVLALPIEVTRDCVVATSFHVKPLLRWIRVDEDFLVLGMMKHSAYLYSGSQHALRLIDTLEIPQGVLKKNGKVANEDAVDAVVDWIALHTKTAKPRLFVVAPEEFMRSLRQVLHYPRLRKHPEVDFFSPSRIEVLCTELRSYLEAEALWDLEKVITEFHVAEDNRAARRNIFQIAKAVAEGRVRKLMVADGVKIFGKFDKKTGQLVIHPYDLDHEDDDILDDLAQSVLASGGEVVVTAREDIPDGYLAWALVDPAGTPKSRGVGPKPRAKVVRNEARETRP